MDNLSNDHRFSIYIDKWDWQPRRLKEQFGQLTLSDVTLIFGQENDMIDRIAYRLGKTKIEVINILKRLSPLVIN